MFAHLKDCAQFFGRNPWACTQTRPAANKKPLGTSERHLGSRPSAATCEGFSLIELLVGMAVLMVISGGIASAISVAQQSHARTEIKSDMYENVRGVAETMTQEIGQAGFLSTPAAMPTLSAAVAANVAAQAVNVSSTTSMFVGEKVLVGTGNSEELVALTAVAASTITGIFAKAHATGIPINILGVTASGIVPIGTTDGSTANTLNLVGDINADGSLVYTLAKYPSPSHSTRL